MNKITALVELLFLSKHIKVFFLVFSMFLISCVDKQCFFSVSPKLYIDAKLTDTSLSFVDTLQSVSALGRLDTIANAKEGNRLAITLNPTSDTTAITISYKKLKHIDTLILNYNREIALGSPECGYITFFKNLHVIRTTLPKLQIIRTNVDTSKITTLRIFLR
jgi:hypothetical protein